MICSLQHVTALRVSRRVITGESTHLYTPDTNSQCKGSNTTSQRGPVMDQEKMSWVGDCIWLGQCFGFPSVLFTLWGDIKGIWPTNECTFSLLIQFPCPQIFPPCCTAPISAHYTAWEFWTWIYTSLLHFCQVVISTSFTLVHFQRCWC